MTKEEYRMYQFRYTLGENWNDSIESFNLITDLASKLLDDADDVLKRRNDVSMDGHWLLRLTVNRSTSIKKLYQELEGTNKLTGKKYSTHIDPFSIYTLVRSQFEAYCIFNNMFIQHTGDQQRLIYYLWIISGLEYRQRFAADVTPEAQRKVRTEAASIQQYYLKLFALDSYKKLDEKSKTHLNEQIIKDKNIQGKFMSDTSICKQAWHQLYEHAGIKPHFTKMYAFLSLNAHPTYVSVFQMKAVAGGKGEDYARFAINSSKCLMALFIRDYVIAFPEIRDTYLKNDNLAQLVVDGINRTYRGEGFQISDIMEKLLN